MSAAYNRACYELRSEVLDQVIASENLQPQGCSVLDVGCGTGFWTNFYITRGARYTGVDIAAGSIERLRERWPTAAFIHSDVSEAELPERYDIVNVFDVLYHITDDSKWESAVRRLAAAVKPGGVLLVTDTFADSPGLAEHNKMRALARYLAAIESTGIRFTLGALVPTHVNLNIDLGFWRFLNRLPGFLLALDRVMLRMGAARDDRHNRIGIFRREA